MSKHTPGPWMWATSNSWRRLITTDGDLVLCPFNAKSDRHPDCDITDADAELIVAACNACMEVNPRNPIAVANNLVELINAIPTDMIGDKARAAIAKATE